MTFIADNDKWMKSDMVVGNIISNDVVLVTCNPSTPFTRQNNIDKRPFGIKEIVKMKEDLLPDTFAVNKIEFYYRPIIDGEFSDMFFKKKVYTAVFEVWNGYMFKEYNGRFWSSDREYNDGDKVILDCKNSKFSSMHCENRFSVGIIKKECDVFLSGIQGRIIGKI